MATSVSIPPFSPDPDPVECASRWAIWLQSLEFYFAAAEITTDARKKALLLHYVGPTAQEVFVKTLQPQLVTKNLAESYANIIAAFKSHFQPTVNTEFEIFRFRQARQREDETMDQYAARLRALAAHCSFADIDGELKSHIICSCLDPGLRRRALRDRGLDLQQLLSLARTYEATEQQAKEIETGLKDISITGHANKVDSSSSCPNCGTRHSTTDSCPARGYRCKHCQKVDHFAIVCRSRLAGRPPVSPREYDEKMAASHKHSHRHHRSRGHGAPGKHHARGTDKPRGERSRQPSRYHDRSRKPTSRHDYSRPKRERSSSRSRSSSSRRDRAHHISRDRLPRSPSPESSSSSSYTESDGPEESFHVQALHLTHRLPRATVFLDNQPLTMTVDTGSSINVLRESDYQQLTRLPTLHRTNIRLFSFGSTDPLPMLGKFRSSVNVVDDDSRQIDAQFYVVAGDSYTTSLLSFNTAVDIGLVTLHPSVYKVSTPSARCHDRHSRIKKIPSCPPVDETVIHAEPACHTVPNNPHDTPQSTTTPSEAPRSSTPDIVEPVNESPPVRRDKPQTSRTSSYADVVKRRTRQHKRDEIAAKRDEQSRNTRNAAHFKRFSTHQPLRHAHNDSDTDDDFSRDDKARTHRIKARPDYYRQHRYAKTRRDYPNNPAVIDFEHDVHIANSPRTPSSVQQHPRQDDSQRYLRRDRRPRDRYGVPVSI